MKHRPFEKSLKVLKQLIDEANASKQQTGEFMVNATTTTTKTGSKKGKTAAHIKTAIKAAKQYLKLHPNTSQKDLAKIVGIAPMTLTKYLAKKRGPRGPYAKSMKAAASHGLPSNTLAEHDAIKNYIEAKERFATAKEVLMTLLGEK